jgi:uracil-DNA glycosylase
MTDKSGTAPPPSSDNHTPAQEVLDFLRGIRRLVGFQQAIGVESYPRTPELARFIAGQQQPAPAAPRQTAPSPSVEKTSHVPSARLQTTAAVLPETTLAALSAEIEACRRCSRHQGRKRPITGAGTTGVKLLIIADAPSADDEQTGLPMSGEPGLLLDKMLAAIGLNRAAVRLSLLTRCHSPKPPGTEEVDACLPFLLREILLVRPAVICAMGPLTAQRLLHTNKPLSQLRGRFHDIQGIPLMPTFSLEFLLKTPEMKKATWVDLQMIQKKIQAA